MSKKPFAFKNKIFRTYAIVITVVVVLFTAAIFVLTNDMNRKTELYHQEELYKKPLGEVEDILLQMDQVAAQVISNNEILGAFIPLASDGDASNYFEKDLMGSIHIGSLLSSINGTNTHVSRISVFNGNGDYASTGTLFETPEVISAVLDSDHYQSLKDIISQSENHVHVSRFHADTWSSNPQLQLLSMYRPLVSYTNTVYGMVDIQVNADVFSGLSFWESGSSTYFMTDSAGEAVYPLEGQNRQGIDFSAIALSLAQTEQSMVTLEQDVDHQDMLVMAAGVGPSGWLFVRVMPVEELLAPYAANDMIILVASFVLWCCLLLVMYYLSNRIAGPLQYLSQTISNVNLQNLKHPIADTEMPYSTAELNALSAAFHAMLIRLDQSVAMEIQAHMRALQSQMNPHFLFNMLSVIVESSEEAGDVRTVSMCLKLSAMLRYIADYNGDSASLWDELEQTRNYLDLMKDRYEDLFDYQIVTNGPMRDIEIPKMIIQPLAENCFSHGFENCRPPWRVRVEAFAKDGHWTMQMEDNGSGITREKIDEIHAKVETYRSDVATNYKNLRLGGMGLVNTMLRLSLAQNDQLVFSISQAPSGGTLIKVGGTYHDSSVDR